MANLSSNLVANMPEEPPVRKAATSLNPRPEPEPVRINPDAAERLTPAERSIKEANERMVQLQNEHPAVDIKTLVPWAKRMEGYRGEVLAASRSGAEVFRKTLLSVKERIRNTPDEELEVMYRAGLMTEEERGGGTLMLNLSGLDFHACDLTGADFRNILMAGVRMNASILHGCNFTGVSMPKSVFKTARLNKAMFDETNLSRCDFSEATGIQVGFHKADFTLARVSSANLTNCDFRDANFLRSDLSRSDFKGSVVTNARFILALIDKEQLNRCFGEPNWL